MKTVVARAEAVGLLDPERGVGGQTAGVGIEPELHDHVWAGVILWRLQNIILNAGDVRHKGKAVGRIGLDRVGAGGGCQPV